MKKIRAIVLMHKDLMPPDKPPSDRNWGNEDWVTEYDISNTLNKMGHDVYKLGVDKDLRDIRTAIEEFKPHIVFNLLEEFQDKASYDQNVVSYLELLNTPYTGCNPRGLMIARDKALSKKILRYHRIKTPDFLVYQKGKYRKRPKSLDFPLIVKCLNEEASLGISQASVVHNDEKLRERVEFIHAKYDDDAIAEKFIAGRELYVGVFGNKRIVTLPPWELQFTKVENSDKEFYSEKAKFNEQYRERKGIKTSVARLPDEIKRKISVTVKKIYKVLYLDGYARIDLRIDDEGNIYVLEANPNPDISQYDDFAMSAKHYGLGYRELLDKLISLGISAHKERNVT